MDDLKKRGPEDRRLININQFHELRGWARELDCTLTELVLACCYAASVGRRPTRRNVELVFDEMAKHVEHVRKKALRVYVGPGVSKAKGRSKVVRLRPRHS